MKFRNYYIFFLLLAVFSCKKNEPDDVTIIPKFVVQIYANNTLLQPYWSTNEARHSYVQSTIPDTSEVVLKLNDTTNVAYVRWNVNGKIYIGKMLNLGKLKQGTYDVNAVVYYYTPKGIIEETRPLIISKDWPNWGYTFKVYAVLYIEDYPFYADPYSYDMYETTSHITTTTTVQTHTTIINYSYSIKGAEMNRMTYYRYIAITLPENESIEVKQYHFTDEPRSQSGVWFGNGVSSDAGNSLMGTAINDILRLGWQIQFIEELSPDNFFNVTAIITEKGVKKIVGDYKYNDDIKGKFKLRIE